MGGGVILQLVFGILRLVFRGRLSILLFSILHFAVGGGGWHLHFSVWCFYILVLGGDQYAKQFDIGSVIF